MQGIGIDRSDDVQVAQAGFLTGLGDQLLRWYFGRSLVRTEAPQIDQGADGDVKRPLALTANMNGFCYDPSRVPRYHYRCRTVVLVEARQFGIGTIGGHLIVDSLQQYVDLGLKLGRIADDVVRHLDGVVSAHGAAGDVDLRLRLDRAFLTAPCQEKG